MKPVNQLMKELRANGGVTINGRWYVNYTAFMWLLQQSTHANQLARKQDKYPAHFITVNEQPFVTEDYARHILDHHRLQQAQADILRQAPVETSPPAPLQRRGVEEQTTKKEVRHAY
ncbi:MAG TPA: hypothetical protein PLS07_00695 [Niabella sp.]|nr:hypothetical protein [Niabella sp.]HQW14274.1 hypothetical protein [Niabella sp.]HQX18446.1 hypothetical protein [Niabella sp.]HQX40062.1 hypothetical protein [Niabella sp.]HRB05973.1 hypothetical protein [Niabella sp.]